MIVSFPSHADRDALSTSCKTKTEADTTVSKDFTGAETLSSKAQTYETTPETAKAMGRHKGCPFMKDIPKTDVGRLMWETHQFTKTSDLMRTEYSMKATVGRSKMSGISDSTSVPTYTNLPVSELYWPNNNSNTMETCIAPKTSETLVERRIKIKGFGNLIINTVSRF